MKESPSILRVAISMPLRQSFDYLAPADCDITSLQPGQRLEVPFGNRKMIAMLLATDNQSAVKLARLKPVLRVIDNVPILSPTLMQLYRWAAEYYQHPIGEVMLQTLPKLVRQGRGVILSKPLHYRLSKSGAALQLTDFKRAPKRVALLQLLNAEPQGVSIDKIMQSDISKTIVKFFIDNHYLETFSVDYPATDVPIANSTSITLMPQQQEAVESIHQSQGFNTFLLHGITGSGKTEVYLQAMLPKLQAQQQIIVLVPEIGLTPQAVARYRQRFNVPIAVLHSGLSDGERYLAWAQAYYGEAEIIIGTRSAIFAPLKNPGMIIVDEAHDPSFKQQSGFRYHARDLAVMRGRLENIPVILGSATPSMESIYNVKRKRYHYLALSQRPDGANLPAVKLIDLRKTRLEGGLSPTLIAAIKSHLENQGQVLLFLNRRGYAPLLMCHLCGYVVVCPSCDARLTLHHQPYRLICHHCERQVQPPKACPSCKQAELMVIGQGTERLTETLQTYFARYRIARVDRDSMRRKDSFQKMIHKIKNHEVDILVGTQILAKGHHFPNLTLVAIIDADSSLMSIDFRALERMAQLFIQVAGRAGRAEKPGEVLIQTHQPQHHLLQVLLQKGYNEFARATLQERQQVNFPPFGYLAMFRAEAKSRDQAHELLNQIKTLLIKQKQYPISVLGPIAANMERKADRYRAQLLLQTSARQALQQLLNKVMPAITELPTAKKTRWSIDVDPIDVF